MESQHVEMDEEIIRIMQNVLTDQFGKTKRAGMAGPTLTPYERSISAWSNLLYLDALLNTKRFDEYFGVAINVISVYSV